MIEETASIINFYGGIGEKIFLKYTELSRPILDFLHVIFKNIFYFFLFVAIVVSAVYFVMSVYVLFRRKKQPENGFDMGKAPFVTVQIPTYNELAALRCAKKCLEFDYPKDKFEVIIGDDSNDKSVQARIDAFAGQHKGIIVTRRGSNIGYKAGNLNHMLKSSSGEIIVLFDSDFMPDKDFLKRIVAPFVNDAGVSGVQARWKFVDRNRNLVSVLGSTISAVFHHIFLPFTSKRAGISFLCGSAEAVRKEDLLKLGKWENGSLTEDIEFSLKLFEKGKSIVYLDNLECYGEVPYKAKDLYGQQMRWAYGVISSYRKHFKTLILSRKRTVKERVYISAFCSGYLLSFLFLVLFVTGVLSFVTDTPGPIDWGKFSYELSRNVLFTSGIIFASVVAMAKTRNIRKFFSMLMASFSFGLVVTYYVNKGIVKVFLKRPMQWYMLSKSGNKI